MPTSWGNLHTGNYHERLHFLPVCCGNTGGANHRNRVSLGQEGRWDVESFSSQPGVFLLQQPSNFACMLLIQEACYLYIPGSSALHSPSTGIWFAEDRGRDLSKLSLANDACNLHARIISDEGSQGHTTSSLAAGRSQSAVRRLLEGAQDPEEEEDEVAAPGFYDEFETELHDISDIKRRAERIYGHFVSFDEMVAYVNSSNQVPMRWYYRAQHEYRNVAVVPRYTSYMGNFAEAVVPIMEAAGEWRLQLSSRTLGQLLCQLPCVKLVLQHCRFREAQYSNE